MKKISIVILATIAVYFIFKANYLFSNKFHSGECIQDYRDGYIWRVNNFNLGTYSLMGWQDNAWGSEVKFNKDTLEREDYSGTIVYHQVDCPRILIK